MSTMEWCTACGQYHGGQVNIPFPTWDAKHLAEEIVAHAGDLPMLAILSRHRRDEHSACNTAGCWPAKEAWHAANGYVALDVCQECLCIVAGCEVESEEAQQALDALERNWPSSQWHLYADGEELGFSNYRCEGCDLWCGDQYRMYAERIEPKFSGVHDCVCCGSAVYGESPTCAACHFDGSVCPDSYNFEEECDHSHCDMANAWHCFTGHCDGSGCTYPGECEGKEREMEPSEIYARETTEAIEVTEPWASARILGAEHGQNAAEWIDLQRTTESGLRTLLAGLEDNDPAVWDDFYRYPLSGEYADDLTPVKLMHELGAEPDCANGEYSSELLSGVCDAYEEEHSGAWAATLERRIRYQLGEAGNA